MPDAQNYNDYIEPPPKGFAAPQTPSDALGLRPPPSPPQPSAQPPVNAPPPQPQASAAIPDQVIPPTAAAPQTPPIQLAAYRGADDGAPPLLKTDPRTGRTYSPALIRDQMTQRLVQNGMSPAMAAGIVRAAEKNESGLNPYAIGDNGTSYSIFQAHGTRAVSLAEFAAKQGKPPTDPIVNADWATQQYYGGDPIATRHRHEIEQAAARGDVAEVAALHEKYFERPQSAGGGAPVDRNTVAGPFNSNAQEFVNKIMQQAQAKQPAIDEAISEAKDLHQMSRAMAAKWMSESDKPPQNMRQAWSQWGQVAGALALFGSLFGRHSMNAALNAAGEMMQAANTADQRAYDIAYKQWSDHLDRGMKAIEVLNKEAMDIISDAKLSYDQQLSQLDTLAKAYGIAQSFDHAAVQKQFDDINLQKDRRALIDAQNSDTLVRNSAESKNQEWLADPKNADKAIVNPATGQKEPPADVQAKNFGEAKKEVSGTATHIGQQTEIQVTDKDGKPVRHGMAYTDAGGNLRWMGTGELVQDTKPEGGSIDKKPTGQPRSAAAMYIQKYMEEHPTATSADIARASADYTREQAIERAFATGQNANQMRQLNTLADHLRLLKEYSADLQSGQIPRANAIWQRLMTELGHPEVTSYELGHILAADELVRLITATGGTIEDRSAMQRALAPPSASPDQIGGAIRAAGDFAHSRFEALEQLYARNDPDRRHEFESEMLTPAAKDLFAANAGGGNSVPVPDAFKHDPDGTTYKKGGVVWVKKGDRLVATPGATGSPR